MGNPFRGEAELKVGDQSYRLALDINGFIEAEEASGLDTQALLAGVDASSFKAFRAILFGALRRHHPDVHLIQAGEIMSDAGFDETAKLLTVMLLKAMPPVREKAGNPPKAKAGTG
jgi:hypothetical protein